MLAHRGYFNAKATSARKFLRELVRTAPYAIQSIQVDGGSEFMAEFETECAALDIPLIVLPPSKPKYNGGVERANRTFADNFYNDPKILADSIGARRLEPKKSCANLRANIAPTQHCKGAPQWSIYESVKQRPHESQII